MVASFSFFGLQSLSSYIVNCVVFRLFLRFYLAWFLSTTIHIFDMYWFTIIFGCVCFKKSYYFIFSTTLFFVDRNVANSPFLPCVFYEHLLPHHFFLFNLSISSLNTIISFESGSSVSFLMANSLFLNF